MSDLHFEFHTPSLSSYFWANLEKEVQKDSPDCAVLAGDILSLKKGDLANLLIQFRTLYPKVVYIPGNHEFFYCKIEDSWKHIEDVVSRVDGVTVLHNELKEGFYGGTLYYPAPKDPVAARRFIDYYASPDSIPQISLEHNRFLAGEPGPIVVSHHFPTDESIAPRWVGDPGNIFFCANIDSWIQAKGKSIKLWIHGHTHDPMDFQSRHGFRVYANPFGYPAEGANPLFWKRLLVTT